MSVTILAAEPTIRLAAFLELAAVVLVAVEEALTPRPAGLGFMDFA